MTEEKEIELQNDLGDSGISEMSLDEMNSGQFLKNPGVGETIEFVVDKVVKNRKNLTATDPQTGKQFSTALSNVDYKVEVHTSDGKIFSVRAWEIFGKMKAALKMEGKIKGVHLKIHHALDGMKRENKGKNIYQLWVMHNGSWQEILKPEVQKK